MHQHPLNLGIRFLLETTLVIIFSIWAWNKSDGPLKLLASMGLPLAGMALWAIFKVEGDPGKAIIAVPGWVRLLIEAGLFLTGFFMLRSMHHHKLAWLMLGITLIHYAVSFDRIKWLLHKTWP